MIDQKRRSLLTAATAATAIAAVPGIASAIGASTSTFIPIRGTGIQLSFSGRGPSTLVTVSNSTSSEVSLKHVYPGIVHANGHSYDLNSILSHQPMSIRPGESNTIKIQPIARNSTEQKIPQGLSNSQPLMVSTRYDAHGKEMPVQTVRRYMA